MKVLCFIYLSEGDVLQKEGNAIATNVASQPVEKGHSKAMFSPILSGSFTVYIKLSLFHIFHKVFEVIDNIKTCVSWGTFKKINQENEILFGGEITCNKPTVELLTLCNKFNFKYFGSKIKMENMII